MPFGVLTACPQVLPKTAILLPKTATLSPETGHFVAVFGDNCFGNRVPFSATSVDRPLLVTGASPVNFIGRIIGPKSTFGLFLIG